MADSDVDLRTGDQPPPERTPQRTRAHGRPASVISVERTRALRRSATPQERKLWRQLRLLRPAGLHFRRQVPIGRFVVDFACLKQRIVVEIDGGQHSLDAHAARDRAQDEALSQLGFSVKRFWNAEVDASLDGIVETILAAVDTRADPSCERVEGVIVTSVAPVPTPTLPSGEGEALRHVKDQP